MRIYWTLKSIPELAHLPSQERNTRWRCAYTAACKDWQCWCMQIIGAITCSVGAYFFDLSGAFLGGTLGGLLFSQVTIVHIRRVYPHLLINGKE
jgi:hypothetical protein